MDKNEVLSLFSLVGDRPLQVTLRKPTGRAWATDMPILFPRVPEQYGDEPVLRLSSTDTMQGFYSDFYVEKVGQDAQGNLVLTSREGNTATVKVGGK